MAHGSDPGPRHPRPDPAAAEPDPPRLLGRLAALVAGPLRYPVIVAWIAIAAAATVYLPTLGTDAGDLGIPVPDDAPAIRAEARSAELFGYPLISRTLVVQRDPAGLTGTDRQELLRPRPRRQPAPRPSARRHRRGRAAGGRPRPGGRPPGQAGTTAVTYLFFRPDTSPSRAETVADRFAGRCAAGRGRSRASRAPARRATSSSRSSRTASGGWWWRRWPSSR